MQEREGEVTTVWWAWKEWGEGGGGVGRSFWKRIFTRPWRTQKTAKPAALHGIFPWEYFKASGHARVVLLVVCGVLWDGLRALGTFQLERWILPSSFPPTPPTHPATHTHTPLTERQHAMSAACLAMEGASQRQQHLLLGSTREQRMSNDPLLPSPTHTQPNPSPPTAGPCSSSSSSSFSCSRRWWTWAARSNLRRSASTCMNPPTSASPSTPWPPPLRKEQAQAEEEEEEKEGRGQQAVALRAAPRAGARSSLVRIVRVCVAAARSSTSHPSIHPSHFLLPHPQALPRKPHPAVQGRTATPCTHAIYLPFPAAATYHPLTASPPHLPIH